MYFAPCNHNLGDRELYESRYGKTWYSFVYKNDLFIILDPNIDRWNISGEQFDFLKETIGKNAGKRDNIFVFFHQVLWWAPDNQFRNASPNSTAGRADTINFRTETEPIFKNITNPVYMFAGDVGALPDNEAFMYYKNDNITFITSGMGGGVRDNFIIVNVMKDKSLKYNLVSLKGEENSLGELEDYKLP